MNIHALAQLERVTALSEDGASAPAERAPSGVVGLAPLTLPRGPLGLAAPRAGLGALRVAHAGDASLIAEARAHFLRQRPEVVAAVRRGYPDAEASVVDALADEWVARSVRRYSALLDGRNDGIQDLTVSGLLLTIAYEGDRPAEDPVRVIAERHQAKLIESFTRAGLSAEEAAFQARTVGARLSRSTSGWRDELPSRT